MKLSVVVATYNREKLLKQTLDSLKKNSDNEIEIIVVDDASTEPETIEYLDSLKDIKLFRFSENVGVARVKNKGIEMASLTEYIHICDNDIYYLPHWDTGLIEILEKHKDVGLVGGKRHPHLVVWEVRDNGKTLIMENQPGYSFFMERKFLDEVGWFETENPNSIGHADSIMCERVKAKNKKIATVDPPVIYHCGAKNFKGLFAYPEMQIISQLHSEIKFL